MTLSGPCWVSACLCFDAVGSVSGHRTWSSCRDWRRWKVIRVCECVCVGEAEIQVRVTDMNDNAPFFSELVYTAQVPENTDIGTIVMTVTADDLDEGLFCRSPFLLRSTVQ